MKHVKSEVPYMAKFTRSVLQWASKQQGKFTLQKATDAMANHFNLSIEARDELTKEGQNKVYSHTSWSTSHLKYANLLRKTGTGVYEVTDAGKREALSSNKPMTIAYLEEHFPIYRIGREQSLKNKENSSEISEGELMTSQVPQQDDFMRPILEYASQCSGSFTLREITDGMMDYFNLSAEARAELKARSNKNKVYDNTTWSISYLKRAEFLRQTGRGHYEITDAGRKATKSSNEIIISHLMQNVPAYRNWKQSDTSEKSYDKQQTTIVPEIRDFTRPVLQWASKQQGEFTTREAINAMANHFNLSTEARREIKAGKVRFHECTTWSISHLKYANLLRRTSRGIYEITDAGKEEAFFSDEVMTEKYLKDKFPCYQIARKQASKNRDQPVSEEVFRLWQLKQKGALTQEEFEKQKAKLFQS